jgi:hypothetical protein
MSPPRTQVDDFEFPVLSQLFFRRVIWDEFHELQMGFPPKQLSLLLNFHSHFLWGLTGNDELHMIN